MVVGDVERTEDAAVLAQRSVDVLTPPFMVEVNEVYVTTSIGISMYPLDGDDLETLLKNADVAMYHAKERGRNGYQFYSQSINAWTMRRLAFKTELRKALQQNQLLLHYQPRLDIRTGQVVGAEALVRWRHRDAGMVAPGEFIPLAEESGLIIPLGEWVLRRACTQARAWQIAGLPFHGVSVNLSATQFNGENFVDKILRILQDTGLSPQHLELELTESTFMENTDERIVLLGELKRIGLRISIDDFGTGYSSLAYLKRFPIDALKIDQSFIRDVTTDADDAAIVTTTIALAHNLHLKVVAEGVEKEAQLTFLRERGCDEIQGYVYGRPLAPEAFVEWMRKEKKASPLPI